MIKSCPKLIRPLLVDLTLFMSLDRLSQRDELIGSPDTMAGWQCFSDMQAGDSSELIRINVHAGEGRINVHLKRTPVAEKIADQLEGRGYSVDRRLRGSIACYWWPG